MPKPTAITTTSRSSSSSCLLRSLHRHVTDLNLSAAISLLPLLFRHGLRPPLSTLSLLLHHCLSSPSPSSPSLSLARRLHLYLHLAGLKRTYPSHLPLSNRLLSLHFLLRRPDLARRLFDRMPHKNLFTHNAMLAGYSRLGMLPAASRFFASMPSRDAVSYNTLISALARAGRPGAALRLYRQLRASALPPNRYTFCALLSACAALCRPAPIKRAHGQVLVVGFLPSNLVISTSLVDCYAKCGCLEEARRVFDEMCVKDVQCWTALVYGYAKSGELEEGRRVFDMMPERNSVSWTALIGGYARFGLHFEAFDLLRRMVGGGLRPDQFTFSSSLCACAALGSVKYGKQIHARLVRSGFSPNSMVFSSLIDMYSKCGDLEGGWRIFDHMDARKRDSVVWNTMMSATAQHGDGREAIRLFEKMIGEGNKPDENTFVVLLTVCGQSGLVAEAMQHFGSMSKKHGIVPEEDHYACVVDLLGRGGHFDEALDWLRKISCHSSARVWGALLRSCRDHKNLHLGKEVAERLIELDPHCSEPYALLSDIYGEVTNWEHMEKNRCLMEEKRLSNEHAASWIDIDNIIHSFRSVDQMHPSKKDIYDALECLVSHREDDSFIK